MDEVSGVVLSAFKIVFGSPDVMIPILAFTVVIAFGFTIKEVYQKYS